MSTYIVNRKTKAENIKKRYPNAVILDITSKSPYAGLRILSPFFPHGNIPVPGMPGITATCVEAIWQGLKVFETCGVDYNLFTNDTMENLKRTVRKYGKPIGHQFGDKILNYQEARMYIYIPAYKYVLDHVTSVQSTIKKIKKKSTVQDIVFLDYNTNCDVFNFSKPISHAALVKMYIEGVYPTTETYQAWKESKKNSMGVVQQKHDLNKTSQQLELF